MVSDTGLDSLLDIHFSAANVTMPMNMMKHICIYVHVVLIALLKPLIEDKFITIHVAVMH